ncbi:MAG TPA: sensor histidine kinase [Longimicrobium sp.]|jgi:LytS/YehU family sensor histidine kinase|uniref:sensor histidine kinase n=1 Tax=Longimicrobium sp. TaxID=2029185 RepID=UPI002ED95D03
MDQNQTTTAQPRRATWREGELEAAVVGISSGLAVAFLVYVLLRRVPWPRPFRWRFALLHLVGALAASMLWYVLAVTLSSLIPGYVPGAQGAQRVFMFVSAGTLFYAIVAGVAHAVEGSARAARAEAAAARTQLAALRAQIHPHFLFNALHTVVQLIPADPARATEAAELVADLLRTTLEEQRDEVTLEDEWRFVERYLAVERIRFGDRLAVRAHMPEALLEERVPAFALQTLVENAVIHGAAPRVAPTEIVVTAAGSASELTLTVRNSGDRAASPAAGAGAGTGLSRLRERLGVLYGSAARLVCGPEQQGGYTAVLTVPRGTRRDS